MASHVSAEMFHASWASAILWVARWAYVILFKNSPLLEYERLFYIQNALVKKRSRRQFIETNSESAENRNQKASVASKKINWYLAVLLDLGALEHLAWLFL